MKKLIFLLTMCVLMIGLAQADTLYSNDFELSTECDGTYWTAAGSGAFSPIQNTGEWVNGSASCDSAVGGGSNARYRDMAYDGQQIHNVSILMKRSGSLAYDVRMATDGGYSDQVYIGYSSGVAANSFFYNVGSGDVDSGVTFSTGKWYEIIFEYNVTHMTLHVNSTEVVTVSKPNKDYSFYYLFAQGNDVLFDSLYANNETNPSSPPVASSNCSASEIALLDFDIVDEISGNSINSKVEGTYSYISDTLNETKFISLNSTDTFSVCGDENLTSYNGTVTLSYQGVPSSVYPVRYYINHSLSGTNETKNITLTTLSLNDAVGVVANVKTDDDEKLANHIVELIRYDESTATGSSSDFQITDQNGKANFFVDYAGPRYGFVIRDSNYDTLETTDFAAIVESPFNLIVADNFTNPFQWHIVGSQISADLTYTNSTKSFNFTWTDIDDADNLCLQIQNSTNDVLFDQCSSATSGFLNHTLVATTGTFTGLAVFEYEGINHTYDLKSISLFGLADQLGKDDALIFSYLFFVTISLISFFSPTGGVLGGGVALVLIFFTEMLPIGVREIVGVLMFAIIIFSLFRGRTGA